MFKALVTLALTLGLAAGTGLGTAPRFAERLAEFDATTVGIQVAHTAHLADPEDQRAERAYIALTEHCADLVALYNVGAEAAPADFAAAHLPASLDIAECR
jgi:cell division GTPase FtsZ